MSKQIYKTIISLIVLLNCINLHAITIINENKYEAEAYINFADTYAAEKISHIIGITSEEFYKKYNSLLSFNKFTPEELKTIRDVFNEETQTYVQAYGYIKRGEINEFNWRAWQFDCDASCNAFIDEHSVLNHRLLFPGHDAIFTPRTDLNKVQFSYHSYQLTLPFFKNTKSIMVKNDPNCIIKIQNNGFMKGLKVEINGACK